MHGEHRFKLVLSAVLVALVLAICCSPTDSSDAEVIGSGGSAYSIDGSTLVIRSNIDSSAQLDLNASDWAKIDGVLIENNVSRIAEGSLSNCEKVKTVTAPYVAFKDKIPSIFGLPDYPKCEIVLMEGEFKHLILCSDIIKVYAGDDKIKSVVISSECRTIPGGYNQTGAFQGCAGLETVRIDCPNLTLLPSGAFQGCTSLVDICLPDSLTSIYDCFAGDTALRNVYTASSEKKEGVVLPNGIYLGNNAFKGCSSIEYAAFGCGTGRDYVSTFSVFENCTGLKTVVLREGIESIGGSFFQGCSSLEQVTFPSTLTKLREYAFKDCTDLKGIDLNGCRLVHVSTMNPFLGCTSLRTEVIFGDTLVFALRDETGIYHVPEGIRSIYNWAYTACDNMVELYLCDTLVDVWSDSLSTCTRLAKLHDIPNGLNLWRGALKNTAISEPVISDNVLYYVPDVFKEYTVTSEIRSIGNSAFYGNEKLGSVIFESSMNNLTMGTSLFWDCKNLSNVQLPKDLSFIPVGMFRGCTSLESIDLTGVSYIYSGAFSDSGLKSVTIPASVNTIEQQVFFDCKNLTRVVFENPDILLRYIPSASTSYSEAGLIFYGCSSLTEVILPENLTSIPNSTFAYCTSLKSIDLPKGLQIIGDMAFNGTGLESVDIPEGVFSIGVNAFRDCRSLENITLPSTLAVEKRYDTVPVGSLAFMDIGTDTADGVNVTIRGCPEFSQNSIFRGAEINNLIIESAPNLVGDIFDSSNIGNIIVSGGSAFKVSSDMAMIGSMIGDDGRMPVKLQTGNGLVDGYMICSLKDSSLLSIGRDDVAISASLLDNRTYRSISVDDENRYFSYVDGGLYFEPKGRSGTLTDAELVYVDKSKVSTSCFIIPSGVVRVEPYAFASNTEYVDTVVLPDSVEYLDVLSMRYVRNMAIDSLKDAPTFGMDATIHAYVFFDYRASVEVVDSLKTTPGINRNTLELFGGYFVRAGDGLLLVQIPKDSATLGIGAESNIVRLTLNLKNPYNRSEYELKDGSAVLSPESDGSYVIPQFQGSKILSFNNIVLNKYALTTDAVRGAAVSYSLLNTDGITHGTNIMIGIIPEKGYEVSGEGLSVKINGEPLRFEKSGSRYVCSYDVVSDCKLEVNGIRPIAERTVTFVSVNGADPYSTVSVVSGYLVPFPGIPTREEQTFTGWYVDGELFDFTKGVVSDVSVEAGWVSEPVYRKIVVDADNGTITIKDLNLNRTIQSGESVLNGTTLLLSYRPTIGFEAREWIVNGVSVKSIENRRVLEAEADMKVHVTSEYTLSSYPYLETDIKTPTSLDECKMVWKAIGTKGFNGMVYTPSILGDYVYSWSDTEIFKIDLLTGEIVKKVDTGKITSSLYYNMVTVGNGYVLAGFAGQVYDADLNPVFRLYLEEGRPSSELKTYYNEGYFYVFTDSGVYKFSATDSDPDSNNIQLPVVSGDARYTHYISWYQGQSNLIFTDRFIIGLELDGDHDQNRYLVTYDIDTLQYIDSFRFDEIESGNLNTGYISYYNGTAYFNTYSPNSNMFSTAPGSWNSIASIDLGSDGVFDPVTVRYYKLGTTSYPSSLIVVGDYGYINAGTTFRVIDMETMKTVKSVSSRMSHGNMAVSVQGDKVYSYLVPYDSSRTLYIFEHDQRTNTLTSIPLRDVIDTREYSSQIVHFGPHGEILYYNDSGYLFCIAPSYKISFVTPGDAVDGLRYYASEGSELPVPEWNGHKFLGWYDNGDFEGESIVSIPIGTYGDKTFYAKFDAAQVKQYAVTFETQWGSETIQVTEGQEITLPDTPVNKNSSKIEFRGWDGYVPGMTASADVTFKAMWVGDVNGDGMVNLKDLRVWKVNCKNSIQTSADDVDGDGLVNLKDLRALKVLIKETSA